jgi:YHS domain-containing protein
MKTRGTYLLLITAAFLLVCSCSMRKYDHRQTTEDEKILFDPVCRMEIDTSTALKTEFSGTVYYFDSEECQKVFLRNPDKFAALSPENSVKKHKHSSNMEMMGGVGAAVMLVAMTAMMVIRVL